jgi:hypothetical protein
MLANEQEKPTPCSGRDGRVLLGAAGCESVRTTSAGAVGVDRKQQMLVPSETIDQGAAQAYEAELKAARDKGVLNTDKAQLARVTTIARRIVPPHRRSARCAWAGNGSSTCRRPRT